MQPNLFHRMNEQTTPTSQLVWQTISATQARTRANRFFRPAWALAISLTVCLVGFSALAARDEATYQFLYQLSPVLAQSLKPVREACEDQGIRMEVVSASLQENTADIIISMKDMLDDRLDETIDLFDSYSINRPFGGSAGCELLGYDAATKTAYFSIHIEEQDSTSIAGSKITFSVKRLLGQKTETLDERLPLSLDGLVEAESQRVRLSGWGANPEHYLFDGENTAYPVLVPQGELYNLGGDMTISAIGLIDGRLHVQMAVRNNLSTDNHGEFSLKAENGTELLPAITVGFNNVEGRVTPERIDYWDAVFDIPQNGLSGYSLYVDYWQSGLLIEGNWQVTFQLDNE